nr:FtsK/SpoIIIE domain-containing protein [Paraburkholderia phosphatilytica]
MSRVVISEQDESTVRGIMRKGLLADERDFKWKALRVALALSLSRQEPPSDDFDDARPRGGEYAWEQVCGNGLDSDFTDAYRALLSVYHDMDLFDDDDDQFGRLLQRHIRRGLSEIRRSWRETHDFHEFLYQELLSRADTGNAQSIDFSVPLMKALVELGVSAEIKKSINGPRLQSYDLHLADATQLRALQRAGQNLALILGTGPISFHLPGTPRTVTAMIPKPKSAWSPVTWSELDGALEFAKAMPLGVVLGVDPVGTPVSFDLASAPHLLVAGTTNSGKSICLHAVICSLLSNHEADELNFCLIDPKKVEFSAYHGLPHLAGREPITDMTEAKQALDDIVSEMERRETELARLGYKNLVEWRTMRTDSPPYLVVCVEELADLIVQHPEAEAPLVRLAQKGRASGIHLVLATQRPDSVTLSGLLRTNVPSRIALMVQKASESRIILDDAGAELLLGQGDALAKLVGESTQRVHCAFISSADIKSVVASARKRTGA